MGTLVDSHSSVFIDLGVWPGADTPLVELGPYWTSDPDIRLPRVQAESERLIVAFTYPRPEPTKRAFLFLGTLLVDWPSGASGAPEDRLQRWQPQRAPRLNLAGVRADSLVTVGQTAMKLLPGTAAGLVFADTSTLDTVT